MSEDYQRIEVITGTARRRHWSTQQKLRIIDESFEPGGDELGLKHDECHDHQRKHAGRDDHLCRSIQSNAFQLIALPGGVTAATPDELDVRHAEVIAAAKATASNSVLSG